MWLTIRWWHLWWWLLILLTRVRRQCSSVRMTRLSPIRRLWGKCGGAAVCSKIRRREWGARGEPVRWREWGLQGERVSRRIWWGVWVSVRERHTKRASAVWPRCGWRHAWRRRRRSSRGISWRRWWSTIRPHLPVRWHRRLMMVIRHATHTSLSTVSVLRSSNNNRIKEITLTAILRKMQYAFYFPYLPCLCFLVQA